MTPLTTFTQTLIVVLMMVLTGGAGVFFWAQNRKGRRGGKISPAKQLWLLYAITVWFVLAPAIACDATVPLGFRALLGGFSVLMWVRGAGELFMLYVTKNWRPPIGMAHNLVCILFLSVGLIFLVNEEARFVQFSAVWLVGFVLLLIGSLLVETIYAFLFHHAVNGQTTGEDGIWFAAADDARFDRINRLTTALNVPFYGLLLLFLVTACGLW
jgi:hypothetical protein